MTHIDWKCPGFFDLQIVNYCNMQCKTCFVWKNQWKNPDNWLLIIQNLLYEIAQLAPPSPKLNISGGEPLLFKNLDAVLKTASTLGFEPNMATNGILLSKKRVQELYDLGLGSLSIPLESMDETTHNKLRPWKSGNHHQLALEKLEMLKGFDGLITTINTVFTGQNYKDVLSVCDFAKSQKHIDGVNIFIIAQTLGTPLYEDWYLNEGEFPLWPQDVEDACRILDKIIHDKLHKQLPVRNSVDQLKTFQYYLKFPKKNRSFPCPSIENGLFVQGSGQLRHCAFSPNPLGNIFENSIEEITLTKEFEEHLGYIKNCTKHCHVATNCLKDTEMQEIIKKLNPSM
jgi:MoaA/NifB/PqqE/SkfB family radical SAM enzyme